MPDFDELKQHVNALSKLLDDPQEGLFSWNIAVCEQWEQIFKMWTGDFSPTISKYIDKIAIHCMSSEARDLLNTIMEEWDKYEAGIRKTNPGYTPGTYAFAYWLVRWSGLIKPNKDE